MVKFLYSLLHFVKDMFCDENGRVSSKRVVGFITMMCMLYAHNYCTRHSVSLPSGTEYFVFSSCGMMGIDSIMKPFKNTKVGGKAK